MGPSHGRGGNKQWNRHYHAINVVRRFVIRLNVTIKSVQRICPNHNAIVTIKKERIAMSDEMREVGDIVEFWGNHPTQGRVQMTGEIISLDENGYATIQTEWGKQEVPAAYTDFVAHYH